MTDPMSEMNRRKERAALVSLAVKVLLTLGKFTAATLSGSLALVSEAGNNLGDVAATLLTSIRSARPPSPRMKTTSSATGRSKRSRP